MKKLTSFLAVMVMCALLFTLTGCSETKKFVGTWKTTIDLTDYLNNGFAEDPEMADYLEVDDFSLVVYMTFNEDGTYRAFADEDQAEEVFKDLKKDLKKGFTAYFEDYIADAGLLMSVEEALEESGMNMDTLVDEAFSDDAFSEIVDGFAREGNFEVKDGKLYSSASLTSAIDETIYETYKISDTTLTLLASYGDDSAETDGPDIYPMVFTKVK